MFTGTLVKKKVGVFTHLISTPVKNWLSPRLNVHKFYLLTFRLAEPLAAAIQTE